MSSIDALFNYASLSIVLNGSISDETYIQLLAHVRNHTKAAYMVSLLTSIGIGTSALCDVSSTVGNYIIKTSKYIESKYQKAYNEYYYGDYNLAIVDYFKLGMMGESIAKRNLGVLLDRLKPINGKYYIEKFANEFDITPFDINIYLAHYFLKEASNEGSNDCNLILGDHYYYGYLALLVAGISKTSSKLFTTIRKSQLLTCLMITMQ
jgi:hypothetical protein